MKIFPAVFSRGRGYAGATNSLSQTETRGTFRYIRIYFWHANFNSRLKFAYWRTTLIDLPFIVLGEIAYGILNCHSFSSNTFLL